MALIFTLTPSITFVAAAREIRRVVTAAELASIDKISN